MQKLFIRIVIAQGEGYSLIKTLFNSVSPILKVLCLSFFLSQMVPEKISHVDFRGISFSQFKIQQDVNSPAMGALIDIRTPFVAPENSQENLFEKNWGQVTLNAGKDSAQLLEKIKPKVTQILISDVVPETNPALNGIVITQRHKQTVAEANKIEEVSLYNNYGELYPLEVRKDQILAAASPSLVQQPAINEKMNELVEEAYQEQVKEDHLGHRVISSETGSQIIVARSSRDPIKNSRYQTHVDRTKNSNRAGKLRPKKLEDSYERPLLISGSIQFFDGLAYSSSLHSLSVTRVFNGETAESGKIWLRDARFEIPVKEAKGMLIAELHDSGGVLLGYSELDLNELRIHNKQTIFDKLKIQLKPVERGARIRVISGYSFKNNILDAKEASVFLEPFGTELIEDSDGFFTEKNIDNQSNIIVLAEAKDHWPTLSRVTSGAVATIRVFHKSMIHALIDIVSDPSQRKENYNKGIIWGLVASQGRPIEGAQIELADESHKVHYMNDFYLPNSDQQKTSENGLFAIVGLEEQIQSIRVTYKGQVFPAQVIKPKNGHISYVEIDFGSLKNLTLKVVDAFDETRAIGASLRALGSEDVVEDLVETHQLKINQSKHNYHFMEVDAGEEFSLMRFEESLSQGQLTLPMIQANWIEGIQIERKINKNPYSGTIVSWFSQQKGSVFINNGKEFRKENLVYFDRSGRVVQNLEVAVGVVIYNVPVGQNTITFVPDNRKTVSTKVLTVDEEFVSSVSF